MDDEFLLELPVYTIKEETFYREFDDALENEAESAYSRTGGTWPGKDLAWFREYIEKERFERLRGFGGPWRYNQICGFLGIYTLGNQLRGHSWFPRRRIYRHTSRKRTIESYGKAFELSVGPEESAEEILTNLFNEIRALRSEPPFRGRYVETGTLLLIGPFVDWRGLMNLSTSKGLMGLKVQDLWSTILAQK